MRNILLAMIGLMLVACGGEMPTAAAPITADLIPPELPWEEEAPLSGATESTQPVSGNVSAPFDIGGVMRQVHFAFREKDGLFEGGDTNYAVKVAQDGSFSVTPFHYPKGKRDTARAERHDHREDMDQTEHREREKPITGKAASFKTLGFPVSRMRTNDKAHLEMVRGVIIEELKNTENGVEQSWRFAKRPETTGDLTITVSVDGLDYIGTTDNGLHFAEKESNLGLRYGIGTWIDANGDKTTIVPQWRNGTITLTVPLDVIKRSTYPAILDPVIGPEFGMDDPVYGPAYREQHLPAIAFDGNNYLVVWGDGRRNIYYTTADIYGTRVTKEGTILDPGGIAINTTTNAQSLPAIVFDGVNYMVVWADVNIYGARVKTDGTVLDPNGIAICTATNNQSSPALAFNGANYLIVWQDRRNDPNPYDSNYNFNDIYGARVTQAGVLLDPGGIAISTAANDQLKPAVISDGSNYLVVWQDSRNEPNPGDYSYYFNIYGTLVTENGLVLDTSGIVINSATTMQALPALAFDGTNYMVVWSDFRGATGYDIYGARLTTNGDILDLDGIVIANATKNQVSPAIAFNGTDYFVAWSSETSTKPDIHGVRITLEGSRIDVADIVISSGLNTQEEVNLAFDGTNYLVVWEDDRKDSDPDGGDSYDNIYGSRVTKNGIVLDPNGIAISIAANRQENPAVAFDGTNYFVVWKDYRNTNVYSAIYGTRVAKDGLILDPGGIKISSGLNNKDAPAVAFDGTNYLVVWEDYRNGNTSDIYGTRVTKNGVVLKTSGFAVSAASNYQKDTSLAFDGTNYWVIWQDYRAGGTDIYGTRISTDGTVLDPGGVAICVDASTQSSPAIACSDGSNCLIAWSDGRNGNGDIYGARVLQDASVLDPNGITISAEGGYQNSPAIAYDGTDYLVVWDDDRNGNGLDIYGSRVSTSGVLLDSNGFAISTVINTQRSPLITYDGTEYLVVWRDFRSGNNYDLYGTRVSITGLLIGNEFSISTDQYQYQYQCQAIASSGKGRAIIVYQHFDDSDGYNSYRISGRLYLTGALGNSCENNSQCDSGKCVDSTCCHEDSCDDDNPCTVDSCAVNGDGTCSNISGNEGDTCDDGNPLTTNDICVNGECLGEMIAPDDDAIFADEDSMTPDDDALLTESDDLLAEDDIIVLPDISIPDEDTIEPIDDTQPDDPLPDESVSDDVMPDDFYEIDPIDEISVPDETVDGTPDETTQPDDFYEIDPIDEDTVDVSPVDDGEVSIDDAPVVADDGPLPVDDEEKDDKDISDTEDENAEQDVVVPDADTMQPDLSDAEGPDETTDDATDDDPDTNTDTDTDDPITTHDSLSTDTDPAKPTNDGCGCSLLF